MKKLIIALAAWAGLAGASHAATFDIKYDASILNVVQLGEVKLKGAVAGGKYTADAGVKTAGLAVLFDQTDITAATSGAADGGAVSWASFNLQHKYGKIGKPQKSRTVTLQRAGDTVTAVAKPAFGDLGKPPATAAQKSAALDPISALVSMGLDIGAGKACGGRYQFFDGKQVAALALSPKSTGTYKSGGYSGDAVVCLAKYEPIAGFKAMTAAEKAAIPTGEIWFAKPVAGFAAPIRVEVPTPVGPARLDVKTMTVG